MKILNVISYWGYEFGGPFVNVANMTATLLLKGHQSSIITTMKGFPDKETYKWHMGNRLVDLEVYNCGYHWDFFRFSFDFMNKFNELSKNFDLVFVHGLWRFPLSYACYVCRKNNIPYMIFSHGMLHPWSLSQHRLVKSVYFNFVEKNNLIGAKSIFVMDKKETAIIEKNRLNKNYAVFYSALDKDDIEIAGRSAQKRGGSGDEAADILYLSRIVPRKGLILLLEAVKLLIDKGYNIRVHVAGEASSKLYARKVHNYINKNDLAGKVKFYGTASGGAKQDLLKLSDIFVLPSEFEVKSVAITEAMSYGIPVVISPGCNMPEIDNKMGYVVERDPAHIAKALSDLIDNKNKRTEMGMNAHSYVADFLNTDKMAQDLIAVINSYI
jgi:glycosyltransferase involved in cell wall biosynthesis